MLFRSTRISEWSGGTAKKAPCQTTTLNIRSWRALPPSSVPTAPALPRFFRRRSWQPQSAGNRSEAKPNGRAKISARRGRAISITTIRAGFEPRRGCTTPPVWRPENDDILDEATRTHGSNPARSSQRSGVRFPAPRFHPASRHLAAPIPGALRLPP